MTEDTDNRSTGDTSFNEQADDPFVTSGNTATRTCQNCGMSFVTNGNTIMAYTPDGTLWATVIDNDPCLVLEPGAPRGLVNRTLLAHHFKGLITLTGQARRSIIEEALAQGVGQNGMGSFDSRSFGDLLVFPFSTAFGSGEVVLIILDEDDPEADTMRSIRPIDHHRRGSRGRFTQGRRPYRGGNPSEDPAS